MKRALTQYDAIVSGREYNTGRRVTGRYIEADPGVDGEYRVLVLVGGSERIAQVCDLTEPEAPGEAPAPLTLWVTEPIEPPEHIRCGCERDHAKNDIGECDWFVCLPDCNNDPRDAGFYPCDEHGRATAPNGSWAGHYRCDECGRVIEPDGSIHKRVASDLLRRLQSTAEAAPK